MMTQTTHPWLWDPPKEYSSVAFLRQVNRSVSQLLIWKRWYYEPNHELCGNLDEVADARYDMIEAGLREMIPDHPYLDLVGWSDSHWETLKYKTDEVETLDLDKLRLQYPELKWELLDEIP